MNRFVKGHGLGNDYLVVNHADLSFDLSPGAVRRLCHRNWGIGSDGILVLVPSSKAEFGLRIFNPDGSEAEKSGNGLRIFAKYLYEHGFTNGKSFKIDTLGGIVETELQVEGGRVRRVTVEMGQATFRAPEIPMHGPDRNVVAVPLQLGDTFVTVTAVSVGKPPLRGLRPQARRIRGPTTRPSDRTASQLPQPDQRPVRQGGGSRPSRDPHLGARGRLYAGLGVELVRRGGGGRS